MMRDLARFHNLRSHEDKAFAEALLGLQKFQTQRLRHTHRELLCDESLHMATEFFICV